MVVTTAPQLLVHHPRQSLRVTADPHSELEVRRGLDPWEALPDVVDATRALTRQLALDAPATRAWVADVARVRGAVVQPRDSVVATLVRALYPLLAPPPPFPPATLPATIPVSMRAAFREPDPREAARLLFGDGATRPVVRALCGLLGCGAADDVPTDLFVLDVGRALAPHLAPDHLASFLGGTRADVADVDRAPLPPHGGDRVAALLAPIHPRRRMGLLMSLHDTNADRERLRFVAAGDEPLETGGVRTWRDLTLQVVLARHQLDVDLGPVEVAAPDPAPTRPPPPAAERYVLRHARTARDLVRLSEVLHNCLDTYAGRVGPTSRILEVLDHGRTTYALHVRNGRIVEFRADRNALVPLTVQDEVRSVVEFDGHLAATRPALDAPAVPLPVDDVARWAARLLAGHGPGRPDWGDVGVLLWAHGVLHQLPDPCQVGADRAVEDACRLVRRGDVVPADEVVRTFDEVRALRRRLRQQATWRTHSGMRAQSMARMLGHVARRHPRGAELLTDD